MALQVVAGSKGKTAIDLNCFKLAVQGKQHELHHSGVLVVSPVRFRTKLIKILGKNYFTLQCLNKM